MPEPVPGIPRPALGSLTVSTDPLQFDCRGAGGARPSGLVLLGADYRELARFGRIGGWPWRLPRAALERLESGATVHAFAIGDGRTGPLRSPLATFVVP